MTDKTITVTLKLDLDDLAAQFRAAADALTGRPEAEWNFNEVRWLTDRYAANEARQREEAEPEWPKGFDGYKESHGWGLLARAEKQVVIERWLADQKLTDDEREAKAAEARAKFAALVAAANAARDRARHNAEPDPLDEDDRPYTRRLASCVERWPGCESGAYDPACCRFPKSCSPHGNHPDDELEPQPAGTYEPDVTIYCHEEGCGAEVTAPPHEARARLRAHADEHNAEPDPLDEDDHRDRVLADDGRRLVRSFRGHWHTPQADCQSICGSKPDPRPVFTLALWDGDHGPLAFAPDASPAPQDAAQGAAGGEDDAGGERA